MSPRVRPAAAARSPFATPMAFARFRLAARNLLAPLAPAVPTSAAADPLSAYGSYVAKLSWAELKDADFRGAHLLGADLSNVVNGNFADFSGAYFDANTVLAALARRRG
jgi:uncharacterized protein YjbI with pentapeptide repeats